MAVEIALPNTAIPPPELYFKIRDSPRHECELNKSRSIFRVNPKADIVATAVLRLLTAIAEMLVPTLVPVRTSVALMLGRVGHRDRCQLKQRGEACFTVPECRLNRFQVSDIDSHRDRDSFALQLNNAGGIKRPARLAITIHAHGLNAVEPACGE